MPAKKTYNYRAMEHSNELEGHASRLRRNVVSGKSPTEWERDTFITHIVGLVEALGWRQELLDKLSPAVKRAIPDVATPIPAPAKGPEVEKKPGGIFSRS